MGFPEVYRKTRERIIASFSFTDIAEGTGVVAFLGAKNVTDTTADYYLAQSNLHSNDVVTKATNSATTATKDQDIDFDVKFNLPKNLRGLVRINITLGGNGVGGATDTWEVYAVLKLRKFDGSTETDIANVQTETLAHAGGDALPHSKVMNAVIDASSSTTHFKKGDILRLTVEIFALGQVIGNVNLGFAHDPKDRNDESDANEGIIENDDTTVFQVNVPFLIDL